MKQFRLSGGKDWCGRNEEINHQFRSIKCFGWFGGNWHVSCGQGGLFLLFTLKLLDSPLKSDSLLTGPWLPCFTIRYPAQKQNKQVASLGHFEVYLPISPSRCPFISLPLLLWASFPQRYKNTLIVYCRL